ncbi:palmitoyltransferase ZDHHC23-like, partial [Pollicipes pollicipes]|uniref:palmitoyltransferase ZDHHC23-like n=1 Tax=Pollicipes pollicipes TaxID=41117 RepID=UPI00188503DF
MTHLNARNRLMKVIFWRLVCAGDISIKICFEKGNKTASEMHATASHSESQHSNLFRVEGSAEPLCCCEYVNMEGEKSHILAVCCDCEAVDDTCDRWIKRLSVPESNYDRIQATVADRLRIPWFGGARPCSWELLVSIISTPLLMLLSTLSTAALYVC